MSEKRKKYTPAKKVKIVGSHIRVMAEMSSKYGTDATQINAWKKIGTLDADIRFSIVREKTSPTIHNSLINVYASSSGADSVCFD